jgi:uncharacterized protein (TIGR02145 family)
MCSCAGTARIPWNEKIPHDSLRDSRDGKIYRTTQIGDRTWMAQNLDHKSENSWCYEDDTANCAKYGRLYRWTAAMEACPSGWHLATGDDWDALLRAADSSVAMARLIAGAGWGAQGGGRLWTPLDWIRPIVHGGWKDPDQGAGTDPLGFRALPAGIRSNAEGGGEQGLTLTSIPGGAVTKGGTFDLLGDYAYFWSASDYDASLGWHRNSTHGIAIVHRSYVFESYAFSVRCVEDPLPRK